MLNKTKNKIKTLCTIDTTDIDLQEGRSRCPGGMASSKGKGNSHHPVLQLKANRYVESPCLGKINGKVGTPIRNENKYFMNAFNGRHGLTGSPGQKGKTKSKSKSLLNCTLSKSKSRVKTDYSISSDLVFKSILSKSSSKTLKNKMSSQLDQTYNFQTFQILQQLLGPAERNWKVQKWYLAKKHDKLYLIKKTRDQTLKQQYENEASLKNKLGGTNIKWRNLQKLIKIYPQRNWLYSIYEYNGRYLSWQNQAHQQVIGKILKNEGMVLKHVIKQISRGISELSMKGHTHGRVQLQNVCMNICEQRTTIRVEGNVKLCNLGHSFHVKEKERLLALPDSIYTPPEVINLKLFNNKEKFDRELIQFIEYYDQPWYVDVWGLGVLILQLIAGEPISIEKAAKAKKSETDSVSLECQSNSQELISMESKNKKQEESCQITLNDILQAQKSMLLQTETQLQKINFDKRLQTLLIRMLSVNPLSRPSPKQIIKDL